MQMEVRLTRHAFDGVGGRSRARATKPQRLAPAHGIGQRGKVIVCARIRACAAHRDRRQCRAPNEQMHVARARFECGRGRIECRCRAADHRHGLARERREIDRIGRVRQMRGRQRRQRRHDVRPAVAPYAIGENDLARRLDAKLDAARRTHRQMQAEMRTLWLDERERRAIANRNAEKLAIPSEIVGPLLAPYPFDIGVRCLAVTRLVPRLKAQSRQARFRSGQNLRRAQTIHPRVVAP